MKKMVMEGEIFMGGQGDWTFFDVRDEDRKDEEKYLTNHLEEYYQLGQRVRVTVEILGGDTQ